MNPWYCTSLAPFFSVQYNLQRLASDHPDLTPPPHWQLSPSANPAWIPWQCCTQRKHTNSEAIFARETG